jgi:hypothetical protein
MCLAPSLFMIEQKQHDLSPTCSLGNFSKPLADKCILVVNEVVDNRFCNSDDATSADPRSCNSNVAFRV